MMMSLHSLCGFGQVCISSICIYFCVIRMTWNFLIFDMTTPKKHLTHAIKSFNKEIQINRIKVQVYVRLSSLVNNYSSFTFSRHFIFVDQGILTQIIQNSAILSHLIFLIWIDGNFIKVTVQTLRGQKSLPPHKEHQDSQIIEREIVTDHTIHWHQS